MTPAYIKSCESGDEWDNCYREFAHYMPKFDAGEMRLLPVVASPEVADPKSWGVVPRLVCS